MEMKDDIFTLLLVLLLAQDQKLLREIDPVLTFWEKHRDSFSQLQTAFLQKTGQKEQKSGCKKQAPMPEMKATEEEKQAPMSEGRKKQSPLREIAGEDVWRELNAYFEANSAAAERSIPSE